LSVSAHAGEFAEHRSFSAGRKWLSDNHDKANTARLFYPHA
jgi:hypothetical protein